MHSDYNTKRAKIIKDQINRSTNQNEDLQQNEIKNVYAYKSPIYHKQHIYDEQNKNPYIRQKINLQKKQNSIDYLDSLNKNKKNDMYLLTDFKSMNDNFDRDSNFIQKTPNNFISRSPYNSKNNNLVKSLNDKNFVFKKKYQHKSYKEVNYPQVYYRNNRFRNKNLEKSDSSNNPVAQKICNIIIKGENNKDEELISGYNLGNNIDADSPNIYSRKNYMSYDDSNEEYENDYNDNNVEREIKKGPMEITISEGKKGYDSNNKKRGREEDNEEYEEEYNVRNNEETNQEQEMDGENEEYEQKDRLGSIERKKLSKEVQLLDDEDVEDNKDERLDEDYNEEENNRVNKNDIEELEEEEMNQVEMHNINNIKRKHINNLQPQKINSIDIKAVKGKVPKEQVFLSSNNKLRRRNYNRDYDIIKDDKIEIIGVKKPVVLQMNKESNVELIKEGHAPIIEIQKVQSLEQPRSNQKKIKNYVYMISKNKENNVDIINEEEGENEPIFSIEKVQNFEQPRIRRSNKKINKNKIQLKIVKLKEANFVLEKIPKEPELKIEKTGNYEQIYIKKKIKRNKFTNCKIVKIKDNNIDLLGIKNISICKENSIEIKNVFNKKKRQKSNYKKYKISNRMLYQYKVIPTISEAISAPKDLRFIIKGKAKKTRKNVKYSIKREIIYFYKSPIIKKPRELSIGGTIKNTINPTINNSNYNNELKNKPKNSNKSTLIMRNRRNISLSQNNAANTINASLNLDSENKLDKKEDKKEEKKEEKKEDKKEDKKEVKKEKNKTYKTTAIFSSNLVEPLTQPGNKEISSIRRRYVNSKSISYTDTSSPKYQKHISNEKSKENILNTEYVITNQINHISNIISPARDSENNKTEKKNENNRVIASRNKTDNTNFEQYNKSAIMKTPNVYSGKTHSILVRRSNYKKIEITRTPTSNEKQNDNISNSTNKVYNNNTAKINSLKNSSNYKNDKNKSHTITIFSRDQEQKNLGRTYISSEKINQNNKRIEFSNDNIKNNLSNVDKVYISNTHKRNTHTHKPNSNSVNTIYITTNLKKEDKKDNKDDNKNDNKKYLSNNNNGYYSSSYIFKSNDSKKLLNNNQLYISNKEKNPKKDNEIKTDIHNTIINYSSNSPTIVNNYINNNIISDKVNNINEKDIDSNKTEKVIGNKTVDDLRSKSESLFDYKYKYDSLYKTTNFLDDYKRDDNLLKKYNIDNNLELSEITRSYLNSCAPNSRPELSDFSKQFLNSNIYNNYLSRPELSNITRAYLISQDSILKTDENK